MSSPNTIILKGDLRKRYDEARAAGTITPGFLIQHDSAGKVVAHSSAGAAGAHMIAIESVFTSRPDLSGQGGTITDNYVTDDLVRFHRAQKGDELYMILAAPGTAGGVTPADFLESNGDGKLRKLASGVGLFKAVEASSGTGEQRLRARVV